MSTAAHRPDMAYIGVRPCDCVTFISLLDYGEPDELAEDVAAVVRSGRRIEQVPVSEAKQRLTVACEHEGVSA